MVGAVGFEPTTPSMSPRCSPAELRARMWGLNSGVLTLEGGLGKAGGWRVLCRSLYLPAEDHFAARADKSFETRIAP